MRFGKPRIDGHRITVSDVVCWHEQQGQTPAQIATDYALTLGQVYAALSYYFDHKAEIDKEIADSEAFAEEMRAKYPSLLQERLRGDTA